MGGVEEKEVESTFSEAVLSEVCLALRRPQTAQALAERFGCHEQTMRRHLWLLKRQGRVEEKAKRLNRKKMWVSVAGTTPTGGIQIMTRSGPVSLANLARWSSDALSAGNLLAGALAYIWRRAYYNAKEGQTTIDEARKGSLDIQNEIKPFLMKLHEAMLRQADALGTLLIDMPEIWDESEVILDYMGADTNLVLMDEAAHYFEEFAQEALNARRS